MQDVESKYKEILGEIHDRIGVIVREGRSIGLEDKEIKYIIANHCLPLYRFSKMESVRDIAAKKDTNLFSLVEDDNFSNSIDNFIVETEKDRYTTQHKHLTEKDIDKLNEGLKKISDGKIKSVHQLPPITFKHVFVASKKAPTPERLIDCAKRELEIKEHLENDLFLEYNRFTAESKFLHSYVKKGGDKYNVLYHIAISFYKSSSWPSLNELSKNDIKNWSEKYMDDQLKKKVVDAFLNTDRNAWLFTFVDYHTEIVQLLVKMQLFQKTITSASYPYVVNDDKKDDKTDGIDDVKEMNSEDDNNSNDDGDDDDVKKNTLKRIRRNSKKKTNKRRRLYAR